MSLQSQSEPVAAPSPMAGADMKSIESQLVDGRLRDELGLSSSDLKVGLTVARNLLGRGAKAEAMRVYVALVLCEPTNVEFQVGLANCASILGENHLALQAASAVIAMAPSDPRGYLLSGRSCLALGNFAEARQDLEDALGLAIGQSQKVVQQEASLLLSRLDIAEG